MKGYLPTFLLLWLIVLAFVPMQAQEITLNRVSTYVTGSFGTGAADAVAYDAASARLFFTGAGKNTLTILDISNPFKPVSFKEVDLSAYGSAATHVASFSGLVAVAVKSADVQAPGKVVFLDAAGSVLKDVEVGAQPVMVVFSSDGTKALTANEGQPGSDYQTDPEGSVSIIDLAGGVAGATVKAVGFSNFNDRKAYLKNKGVRIYGPNASVAQDLEPESITLSPDNARAYVSLQENNAIAVIDIAAGQVLDILPLGYKNHLSGSPGLKQYRLDQLPGWPELGKPLYGGGQPVVKLGGFSGLYFDPKESSGDNLVFYTVPDRGPVAAPVAKANVFSSGNDPSPVDLRPFKLPAYQGRIVRLSLNRKTGQISLDKQIMLRRFNPETNDTIPISGRTNVFGFDETPVTYSDTATEYRAIDWIDKATKGVYAELQYDAYGGDFEGIVRDRDGNFWLCDDYRPGFFKVRPNGALIERYVPAGTAALVDFPPLPVGIFGLEILPAVYNQRGNNAGFEAIAYDPEAHVVYGFIQSPVQTPEGATNRGKSDVIRILGVSAADGKPVSEYVYLLERNREAGLGESTDNIGDAVYIGRGRFLVIERDGARSADAKKNIFEISIQGASNILNSNLSKKTKSTGPNDKTLEMMSADDLAAAGIRPAAKVKVLNLPSIGYMPNDKPEGLTVLPDGSLAVINDNEYGLAGSGVSDEISLGLISFGNNYGLDVSDRDNKIDISAHPVLGMYQPDEVVSFQHDGQTFLLTANEGETRTYGGISGLVEETRVLDVFLDPKTFGNVDSLQRAANLGRLNITTTQGDLDGDGLYDRLYVPGGRSFSILDAAGNLVYDSGNMLESITAQQSPQTFNSSNEDNNSLDARSDDRGPEPKAAAIGEFMGSRLAFIGLEAIGGIMVFNIDNPKAPKWLSYVNNRNFGVPANSADAGDLGLSDLLFVPGQGSPINKPLVVSANAVSGTITIFSFGDLTDLEEADAETTPWRLYPNPVSGELFTNMISDYEVYNTIGHLLLRAGNTNRIDVGLLPAGTYLLRDAARNRAKLFVKQ